MIARYPREVRRRSMTDNGPPPSGSARSGGQVTADVPRHPRGVETADGSRTTRPAQGVRRARPSARLGFFVPEVGDTIWVESPSTATSTIRSWTGVWYAAGRHAQTSPTCKSCRTDLRIRKIIRTKAGFTLEFDEARAGPREARRQRQDQQHHHHPRQQRRRDLGRPSDNGVTITWRRAVLDLPPWPCSSSQIQLTGSGASSASTISSSTYRCPPRSRAQTSGVHVKIDSSLMDVS